MYFACRIIYTGIVTGKKNFDYLVKRGAVIVKKRTVFIRIILIALVFVVGAFVAPHTVKPKLIATYDLEPPFSDTYKDGGYCYFFVQSDTHYCFNGNGQQELQRLAPQFDISQLDVNRYDYVVAVNCRIRSIRYSYGSAYKTMSVGIDTYIADADLTKTQDDSIRVYRMKKVNIDYDYKKYGSIGTDFRVAEE